MRLHTKNALTWVIDGCEDFATNPLLFGHRAPDVLAGQDPALGEISVQVKFINTAPGAPLPDLLQLCLDPARGQEGPSFISFNARADGTFRKAFGVPEGTPGRAHSIQTGLFMTKSKGATEGFCAAQEDGFFPAERIHLHVVGQ